MKKAYFLAKNENFRISFWLPPDDFIHSGEGRWPQGNNLDRFLGEKNYVGITWIFQIFNDNRPVKEAGFSAKNANFRILFWLPPGDFIPLEKGADPKGTI